LIRVVFSFIDFIHCQRGGHVASEGNGERREEEEEERSLIVDLKRHTQLAVAT